MSRAKKPRSNGITADMLKEIQATIAFSCYDSPLVLKRGGSIAEPVMMKKISHIFYGDESNEALDPDFILFEDQFLLGLSKFKGIFVPDAAGTGEGICRMIPVVLHRHRTLFVHAGEGSLEKAMLSRKSLHVNDKKITGRTLLAMAKSV